MRVIPNLYAAMVPKPAPPTLQWVALPGHGSHEVIIDTPDHWASASDFSVERLGLLLSVYRDRYSYYRTASDVRYVAIFKNRGDAAGASLAHSHSQVVALPILPPLIKREVDAGLAASFCLYCNVIEREAASERLISQNDNWILIAPFYSQAPYETWILPRSHISNLDDMNQDQMTELAGILKEALRRTSALLNDPPFNMEVFQMPCDYHMNIRIQPAISKIAGFERGTGVYLNPVPPEQASSELRHV
jgi:UDPglucose--hexose-1-phosphate uridylyltransferase